jgi:23S rRNA pseudouridine2605 synthase
MAEERLQKILARAGYGSRRASEDLISAGRVRINGKIAELGSKADPAKDTITVDQMLIAREQAPVYIALNKPQGILSEVSPDEPRETVRDLVPVPGHMFIVGRLDLDSEGLILLTNDGELANRLTHPRYGHEKEYRVLVGTRPDSEQLQAWERGIILEDGHRTAPAQVRLEGISGKNAWLRVILREGRKRQIREMGRLTGLPVLRILRIRIGSLELGDLKPGQWRQLRPDEVAALRNARGGVSSRTGGRPRSPRREPRRQDADRRAGGSARGSGRSPFRPTADRERPRRTAGEGKAAGKQPGDLDERPTRPGREDASASGRPARPARPAKPARPARPARPGRPEGRPARPASRPGGSRSTGRRSNRNRSS